MTARTRTRLLHAATLALLVVTLALVARLARGLDVGALLAALRATRTRTLLLAGAAALAGHLLYASFDLLGRRYTQHELPVTRIMPVTFVCYVFNLNLGAWLGSVALRYRLYSRLGLSPAVISRVLTISLMTNWLGYLLLAGGLLVTGTLRPAGSFAAGAVALRIVGLLLLGIVVAYLVICWRGRPRVLHLRGRSLVVPGFRFALAQLGLGACNWGLMALVIFLLLERQVGYATVLGVLLASACAGLAAHVPAGLGVLEAVFLALLARSGQVSQERLLAALIGYRALYFLLPLLVAALVFAGLEVQAGKRLRPAPTEP